MKRIFFLTSVITLCMMSYAASITVSPSKVDFGSVSIKGQSLPVTGSQTVTVTWSGLSTEGATMYAEITQGLLDDATNPHGFYVSNPDYVYLGYGAKMVSSCQFTSAYSVKAAGTYTGKLHLYSYDASWEEVNQYADITITVTSDAIVAKTVPFERINATEDLKAGDTIVFVCESEAAVSGALNGTYLESIKDNVKVNATTGKADVPETAQTFVLSKYSGNWQFTATGTSNRLLLDITGKGAFSYGEPVANAKLANWGISISNGVADVSRPEEGTFPVEFNSDRFKPYKSAGSGAAIALYKKAGAAQEVQSSLAISPATIAFGDVALSATTKEVEISYTAENLTDDIIWAVEGTDAGLFDVKEDAYNTRTSGKLTISYKGNGTKAGSVDAKLSYLTQDAKMDAMEGSFPIGINLIELNSISFKENSYAVLKGVEKDLSAEIVFNPANVANKGLTWKFSKTQYYGTISDAGVFKATATGEYIVIATSVLDDNIQAKCTLNVSLPVPASVELGATELTMHVGETTTLTAAVKPDGTEKSAKFASDNTDVATVSNKGVITAKALGKAVITVSADGYPDVKSTCTVNVTKRTVESIAFADDAVTLNLGSTLQLNPTIIPAAAADEYTTTYSSNNESVATVDTNGKVTSVAVGDAVITAAISDKSAQLTIHVVKPAMFAKVTNPSQVGDKDTIILALKSVPVVAGARDGKKLTVLLDDVTVTDTEAFADKAIRFVLGATTGGYTLTAVGASKAIAVTSSDNDIVDANTTNCKVWQFVADGDNGVYVQNTGNTNAYFKYHAGNAAIKPYKAATTGAVYVYAYVRKYVAPTITTVENTETGTEVRKVIRDGQLLIIRNCETYTVTGEKR